MAQFLNDMVIDLAKTTKCKCQRRSQCMTKFHSDLMLGSDGASNQQQQQQLQVKIGFVAAVAFVHKISSQ
uniref:Uncharacterized protein n=1 Tax=Romanomermis culicivorax TaxID=13658 RepID=A0A915JB89_ROMCU